MAKQTKSQKIGSRGHNLVAEIISESDNWIARNTNEDFGIDLEIELSLNEVTGSFIKVQIKSHESVEIKGDLIIERLDKDFLRYVYECRVPVILVVCSTAERKAWYIWIQKWIIDSKNTITIYDKTETSSIGVTLETNKTLQSGLERELIAIATWENETQLYISVKDLAKLALRLYDSTLSEFLFNYLRKYKSQHGGNYFDSLIEEILNLGTKIWATTQGYKVSQLLFQFVRENGKDFTTSNISKIVARGNEVSRTGIIALGILYDEFPEHIKSMNLTKLFEDFPDPRLQFYCIIRERYLGIRSPEWLSKDDLTSKNMTFLLEKEDILNKWANRGDSIFWDYSFEFKK